MPDQLALFATPATSCLNRCCTRCARPFGNVRWQARNDDGRIVVVCPVCAHGFERKRQMP